MSVHKYRFQLVANTPPVFSFTCFNCAKAMQSDRGHSYADLNGPAYKAYYCEPCASLADPALYSRVLRGEEINGQ